MVGWPGRWGLWAGRDFFLRAWALGIVSRLGRYFQDETGFSQGDRQNSWGRGYVSGWGFWVGGFEVLNFPEQDF